MQKDKQRSTKHTYNSILYYRVNFTSWIYYTKVGEDSTYTSLHNGSIVCKETYYGKLCVNKCPVIAEQLHGTCNTNKGWKCLSGDYNLQDVFFFLPSRASTRQNHLASFSFTVLRNVMCFPVFFSVKFENQKCSDVKWDNTK